MGYTTEFEGEFKTDRPVDDDTYRLMVGLATTRRMKRAVGPEYGVEGEFYVDDTDFAGQGFTGFAGQGFDGNILDFNAPPKTQPGLWCQWLIQEDRQTIEWDGAEKFYKYSEWIEYLIERVLAPRNYVVNGCVHWFGEERGDVGTITVEDNAVFVEYY